MTPVDYTLIAIVAISAIIGAVRGLLRSLITWIVALWAGWKYAEQLGPYLEGLLAEDPVNTWVSRALIALGVLLVGTLIGVLLNQFVRMSIFSGFDRFLGFLFGLLRGIVVLGVLAILGQLLELDNSNWWKKSALVTYAETSGDVIRKLVGDRPIGSADQAN